jgi:hypothetical protein
MEVVGRMKTVSEDLISERRISVVDIRCGLIVTDLTLRDNLGLYGCTLEYQGGPESSYSSTRVIARQMHGLGRAGIRYFARHDPAAE